MKSSSKEYSIILKLSTTIECEKNCNTTKWKLTLIKASGKKE